jgi:hypothetical protein
MFNILPLCTAVSKPKEWENPPMGNAESKSCAYLNQEEFVTGNAVSFNEHSPHHQNKK